MKICIIGAGISGMAAGKLLNDEHEVIIYEKANKVGGIARTKDIEGIAYHTVGGHCFNSKHIDVMDFVFNKVLGKEEWHKVERNSKIDFKGHCISYPIEFAIQEIASFDKKLAFDITNDFFNAKPLNSENLEEWFESHFGKTLTKEYFVPYNKKIWQIEPQKMSPNWIEDKLPLPNKKDFFEALISSKKDTMPHSSFYYPNTNNQNAFLESLSDGLSIKLSTPVECIEKTLNGWIINGEKEFDLIINTMPLNVLPLIIKNVPECILQEAAKLKYNKVSNIIWESEKTDKTWTYLPSEETVFHRHIHIGNFFNPCKNLTITESMGEKSYEQLVSDAKQFEYLLEPLDYNVSDHAYVVYDQNYSTATKKIKDYLNSEGIKTLGRFGEWEYYNMDICIKSAISLYEEIR